MQYERKHHQLIAKILESLDGDLLRQNACYFAGGTALALLHGEYRESRDIDFMVSDTTGYRAFRNLLTGPGGFQAIAKAGAPLQQVADVTADQYGIRSRLAVDGVPIKIEIVLEARIQFETPQTNCRVCGITRLGDLDLATEKLLANADSGLDAAIFSRDVIDLAMMRAPRTLVQRAIAEAELAYGASIKRDLERSIDQLLNNKGCVERCIDAMAVTAPKADLLQRVMKLSRQAGLACKPRLS